MSSGEAVAALEDLWDESQYDEFDIDSFVQTLKS